MKEADRSKVASEHACYGSAQHVSKSKPLPYVAFLSHRDSRGYLTTKVSMRQPLNITYKGIDIMEHLILLLIILLAARLVLGRERFKETIKQIFTFCMKAALLVILLIFGSK